MRKYLFGSGFLLIFLVSAAPAWWDTGHGTMAEPAAARLPDSMPQFFRSAGKHLGYLAGEPDRWKNRECRHLYAAEASNHFIDLEDLEDHALPADRYQAASLLLSLKHPPERTGML